MVAHPRELDELGPGDGLGGGASTAHVHERIVRPMQHERRHRDRPQRRGSVAGGGDRGKLASDAVAEGFEIIVAGGGDGTVNEVLNGMGDARDGFERARLAILPLGTVNVFARELAIIYPAEG